MAIKTLKESAAEMLKASFEHAKALEDMPKKISQTGEAEIGGDTPTHHDENELAANKNTPRATPPGNTPPVSAEPRHVLPGNTHGNGDSEDGVVSLVDGSADAVQHDMKSKVVKEELKSEHGKPRHLVHYAGKDKKGKHTYSTEGGKKFKHSDRKTASDAALKHKGLDPKLYEEYAEGVDDIILEAEEPVEVEMIEPVIEITEAEEKHNDEAEDKALIKKVVKPGALKEHVDAILAGNDSLSEEFKTKVATIFETAVLTSLADLIVEVKKSSEEDLVVAVSSLKEELSDQVSKYLEYVTEQWMTENELAIEQGIRTELAEDFIAGLKTLFIEHYVDIPEEKVEVVEALTAQAETLEESLNEEIRKNIELANQIKGFKKELALNEACEGLTNVSADKLRKLVENVEFTTEEEYKNNLKVLKESYNPQGSQKTDLDDAANDAGDPSVGKLLAENDDSNSVPNGVDPEVYALSRIIAKKNRR